MDIVKKLWLYLKTKQQLFLLKSCYGEQTYDYGYVVLNKSRNYFFLKASNEVVKIIWLFRAKAVGYSIIFFISKLLYVYKKLTIFGKSSFYFF